jgi:hypothetical protein
LHFGAAFFAARKMVRARGLEPGFVFRVLSLKTHKKAVSIDENTFLNFCSHEPKSTLMQILCQQLSADSAF